MDTGSALVPWAPNWVLICVMDLFSSIMHRAYRIEDTNTLSWDVYAYLFISSDS